MATTLATVMADIGEALETIDGLKVFAFPPQQAVPPFAFVGMPESIDYDLTMGRGFDRYTVPVYVATGAATARDAAVSQQAWADGESIKAAVEAITDFSCRVTRATFTTIGVAAADYAAVVFSIDVAA